MSNKKPDFVETYAWDESVLSYVAILWGGYISWASVEFYPWRVLSPFIFWLGINALISGIALLVVQSVRIRTVLNFTIQVGIVKLSPPRIRKYALRLWPISSIVRILAHFFFSWCWTFCGVAVLYGANDMDDVRFVLYIGFSVIHFGRLVRIIQWTRR